MCILLPQWSLCCTASVHGCLGLNQRSHMNSSRLFLQKKLVESLSQRSQLQIAASTQKMQWKRRIKKHDSCHHVVKKLHHSKKLSFTWSLEVKSLQSCHVLDIKWSPLKVYFKNEVDDLNLNFEAGSWLQEDKENCVCLGCDCLSIFLTICAILCILSFWYLMVKTDKLLQSSYELTIM